MSVSKPKPCRDCKQPLPAECTYYMAGSRMLAIDLYSERRRCSRTTAEDIIRAHLTELGFKKLPDIYLPRSN